MFLFEMFPTNEKSSNEDGYKDDLRFSPEDDNSALKITDTRKVRLTLGHIQKLRLMNELRALEMAEKLKQIRKIYAAKPETPAF